MLAAVLAWAMSVCIRTGYLGAAVLGTEGRARAAAAWQWPLLAGAERRLCAAGLHARG